MTNDELRALADAQPVAWMHIDGRVVPAATMDQAYRDGGAMQSSLRGYTIPLYTHPAPAVPQADALPVSLVRAYNAGYMAGHHDTVEGGFVDIHPSDMDTYHADVVAELGLPAVPQAEPIDRTVERDELRRQLAELRIAYNAACDALRS